MVIKGNYKDGENMEKKLKPHNSITSRQKSPFIFLVFFFLTPCYPNRYNIHGLSLLL